MHSVCLTCLSDVGIWTCIFVRATINWHQYALCLLCSQPPRCNLLLPYQWSSHLWASGLRSRPYSAGIPHFLPLNLIFLHMFFFFLWQNFLLILSSQIPRGNRNNHKPKRKPWFCFIDCDSTHSYSKNLLQTFFFFLFFCLMHCYFKNWGFQFSKTHENKARNFSIKFLACPLVAFVGCKCIIGVKALLQEKKQNQAHVLEYHLIFQLLHGQFFNQSISCHSHLWP